MAAISHFLWHRWHRVIVDPPRARRSVCWTDARASRLSPPHHRRFTYEPIVHIYSDRDKLHCNNRRAAAGAHEGTGGGGETALEEDARRSRRREMVRTPWQVDTRRSAAIVRRSIRARPTVARPTRTRSMATASSTTPGTTHRGSELLSFKNSSTFPATIAWLNRKP